MTDLPETLRRFPKRRPPLPPEYERIYAEHYKENREGESRASSLAQRMEAWMHRQVAADVAGGAELVSSGPDVSTLEIGAGTLNHLPHEPNTSPYDVVEPFRELFADSPRVERVRDVFHDIAAVPSERRYARIISVATLEHICELPEVIARAGLLLREDGCLRAAIPSEGMPLWTLGWFCTTGLEFRLRRGLDYGVLMRHEHVNDAQEIEDVLRYFFEEIEARFFGLGRAFSLYQFFVAREPRLERCVGFLEQSTHSL